METARSGVKLIRLVCFGINPNMLTLDGGVFNTNPIRKEYLLVPYGFGWISEATRKMHLSGRLQGWASSLFLWKV